MMALTIAGFWTLPDDLWNMATSLGLWSILVVSVFIVVWANWPQIVSRLGHGGRDHLQPPAPVPPSPPTPMPAMSPPPVSPLPGGRISPLASPRLRAISVIAETRKEAVIRIHAPIEGVQVVQTLAMRFNPHVQQEWQGWAMKWAIGTREKLEAAVGPELAARFDPSILTRLLGDDFSYPNAVQAIRTLVGQMAVIEQEISKFP
jgi:hypothetical protein